MPEPTVVPGKKRPRGATRSFPVLPSRPVTGPQKPVPTPAFPGGTARLPFGAGGGTYNLPRRPQAQPFGFADEEAAFGTSRQQAGLQAFQPQGVITGAGTGGFIGGLTPASAFGISPSVMGRDIVEDPAAEQRALAAQAGATGAGADTVGALGRLAGLVDPSVFQTIINSLGPDAVVLDAEFDPDGGLVVRTDDGEEHRFGPELVRGRSPLEAEKARLDAARDAQAKAYQDADIRIREQGQALDQELAELNARLDVAIAQGNWENTLQVQRMIDERELAQRQLEREKARADAVHLQNTVLLEARSQNLEILRFFQGLATTPGSYVDLFNLQRGLAPVGAGGPLPGGFGRVVPGTPAEQFGGLNFGGLLASLQNPPALGEGLGQIGAQEAPLGARPAAPTINLADLIAGGGGAFLQQPAATTGGQAALPAAQQPGPDQFGTTGTETPAYLGGTGPEDPAAEQRMLAAQQAQGQPQQAAPLPPALAAAFAGQSPLAQYGALRLPSGAVPVLSPQQLTQLSPSERALYQFLYQAQGIPAPEFERQLVEVAPSPRRAIRRRTA